MAHTLCKRVVCIRLKCYLFWNATGQIMQVALSSLYCSMYISAFRIDWNEMQRILVCVNFRETIELQKYPFIFHQHVTIVVAGNLYSSDRCKFGLLAWREWIFTVVTKWWQVCLPSRFKIISCSNTDLKRKLEWFSKRKMCKRLVLRLRMVQIID